MNCGSPLEEGGGKLSQAIDDISDQHTILLDPKVMQQRIQEEEEKRKAIEGQSSAEGQASPPPASSSPAPTAAPAVSSPPPAAPPGTSPPGAFPPMPRGGQSVAPPPAWPSQPAGGTPMGNRSGPPPVSSGWAGPGGGGSAPPPPPPGYAPPAWRGEASGGPYGMRAGAAAGAPLAGLGSRFAAWIIDQLILNFLMVLACIPLGVFSIDYSLPPEQLMPVFMSMTGIFFMVNFLLSLTYFTLFIAHGGQTPGKMLLRVKVVDLMGEDVGYGWALMRAIGYSVDGFLCGIGGYLFAFFREDRRALHDLIAQTKVIAVH